MSSYKNLFKMAVILTKKIIESFEFKCDVRERPEDFSRGRKLGFVNTIAITLNFLAKSAKLEIDHFFEIIKQEEMKVKKQAYFDARNKLKVDAFKILFEEIAKLAHKEGFLTKYKGFRVYAIDGSTLALEDTPSNRAYFGVSGAGNGCAAARASTMVDVLNKGVILDAQIDKYSIGEREIALRHHQKLVDLGKENAVIIYDRGYISLEMVEDLNAKGINYVFRVKRGWNGQIDGVKKTDSIREITVKGQKLVLRVIKIHLGNGEIETLATNLFSKEMFPTACFKELYFMRWGVESSYKTIKSILQIENFSGTSTKIIEQDFYATMYLKNMVAFAQLETDDIIDSSTERHPNRKYGQITNTNLLVGYLKDKFILAILEKNDRKRDKIINEIFKAASKETIPVRDNRSFNRAKKHKSRFNNARKPAL